MTTKYANLSSLLLNVNSGYEILMTLWIGKNAVYYAIKKHNHNLLNMCIVSHAAFAELSMIGKTKMMKGLRERERDSLDQEIISCWSRHFGGV